MSLGLLQAKGDEGVQDWECKFRILDGNDEELVLVFVVSKDTVSLC